MTRTLIENPGTTFAEIPLLLWEDTVREKLLANLKNPQSQMFWMQYGRKTQRDRDELISSTINKVDAYLHEPMIANIVSQEKTTINFRQIMDEGKILLVHLSPQLEEMSRLIGAILIGQILMAAFSRVDTREEKRRQLNLFVDEFQRFATSDFATLISEARKFRIATTLSHQTLSQLDEANKAAAIAAGNLIVFRVSGDDAKALARNFDTTPTKEIVGEEPVRAPVSDVIGHLIKRGHNNERVTRFAQVYLQNFEDLMHKIAQYADWQVYGDYLLELRVQELDVRKSRELLNESLYRSMVEKTANFLIPPLALYLLAVAQADASQQVFFRYINYSGWIIPPHYFQGFYKGAEALGHPCFINQEAVGKFIGSCRKDRAKNAASEAVKMITELRFAMTILAQQPILVDTGQYQPKYQNRTFADMENEIAANLTKQPNFQAKVKLLSGEHVIHTKGSPHVLSGDQLTERINQIKTQMRSPEFGYCKYYKDVEKEIRERQDRWRSGSNGTKATDLQPKRSGPSEEPPPTHY